VFFLLGCAHLAFTADNGKGKAAAPERQAAKASVRPPVAVLDFTANDPATPALGSDIAAALTAMLSGEAGITLVERQSLAQTLHEHELNLTGLVSDDQAVKIGKLVGAKIMVTGRAFRLGKDLFITAKLIGTETSLIEAVMVKDSSSADTGAMVVALSEKVAQKLRQCGPKLVAGAEDAFDPLPALKKKLADRRKPVVAVVVREQHHAAPLTVVVVAHAIDPAVETEIKKLLTECGFTVQDVAENESTEFAHGWAAKDVDSWPRGLEKVDALVAGEAFSEFAARIGNIVSCSARAEINLVNHKDGKIVVADRVTTRTADLSENIAGKKALQKAGRELGIRILEHFAETLPVEKTVSHKKP
jgi:TolB-like protein